ncbi:hypothetical protein WMY93_031552 [Mugilogobius chulae]|uniref:UPAR/Ly6 domain-containing protein n=1 Tax=Mugilogobius chulae TaxID=88201 RepID=A0AAW0MD88_9GOBI
MMKMKLCVVLVLFCALLGPAGCIQCYSCQDYSGSCTKVSVFLRTTPASRSRPEVGGDTYRRCIKYSECDTTSLSFAYPNIASFTSRCCTYDLCNSAHSSSASALIGLLCSVLALWWTAY